MDTFKTTPMVDLIHQVPAPATTHKPPTCDPQVSRYTALTGPDMKGSTRLVFRVIGDFTNPHTGKACPGFDTIAFWANVSKGTVSNAVKELRLLGVLDAEERLTATGKKAFSYTLTHGLATDWTPRPRVDRGGDSLEHFRLRELTRLQQENETLKVRLGIDPDTGEILNERGGEERLCSEIKELDYPPPSVQKNCVHILNTEIERDFHNPPADFDRDYALAALEAYAGEQGWRSTGAAQAQQWTHTQPIGQGSEPTLLSGALTEPRLNPPASRMTAALMFTGRTARRAERKLPRVAYATVSAHSAGMGYLRRSADEGLLPD